MNICEYGFCMVVLKLSAGPWCIFNLTFAYVVDIIDIEEFVFFHDYNLSKPVFPYWKFGEFNLEAWDDVEFHTELQFAKNDLHSLQHCLKIPDRIVCKQRTVCSGMEGLCILLKWLSFFFVWLEIMVARNHVFPMQWYDMQFLIYGIICLLKWTFTLGIRIVNLSDRLILSQSYSAVHSRSQWLML